MSNKQTIKAIENDKYSISIFESVNGKYYIKYASKQNNVEVISNGILDYTIASHLFDLKIKTLDLH